MRRALIVVGKAPAAGAAKTRLTPPLSAEAAAELYAGFLQDTFDLAASLGWEHTSLVHPRGDGPALARLLPGVQLLEQRGEGLGAALASAFAHQFGAGSDTAVLIGSDNPTLPAAPLETACIALQAGADLAIGPTTDGGYYLIGLRQTRPELFQNIDWSTPRVYAQTLSRARHSGLRVHPVAEWYDVDEPADVDRLSRELADAPPERARHTRRVLERIGWSSPWGPAASARRQSAPHTRA